MLLSSYFPLGHTTSSLRSLTPLLVPSPLPSSSQDEGRIQGLFHARLCGVIVLAHVRVRVRMHVCVMCLSARCASGYVCSDVHVHVHVHVPAPSRRTCKSKK